MPKAIEGRYFLITQSLPTDTKRWSSIYESPGAKEEVEQMIDDRAAAWLREEPSAVVRVYLLQAMHSAEVHQKRVVFAGASSGQVTTIARHSSSEGE